jgi:hypothetical protein
MKTALRVGAIALMLSGCGAPAPEDQGNNAGDEVAAQNAEILAHLEAKGISQDRVRIGDDFVIVDGDVLFDREVLLDDARGIVSKMRWYTSYSDDDAHPDGTTAGAGWTGTRFNVTGTETSAYWFTAPAVSPLIVGRLFLWPRVADAPSGSPVAGRQLSAVWQTAFRTAAQKWSNVILQIFGVPFESSIGIDYGFRVGRPTGSGISVSYCDLSVYGLGSLAALARAPAWGYPGDKICVNPALDAFISPQGALWVAMHEIGHTLGFAHCDVPPSSQRPNSEVIWGTDDVCTAAEVMNQAAPFPFPNDFSEDERWGILSMYPPE